MRLQVVYKSKREEYRIRQLRRNIARMGISALCVIADAVVVAGLIGALVSGMALDSENYIPVLCCFIGSAAAAGAAVLIRERVR